MTWFEGNYQAYADWVKETRGADALEPTDQVQAARPARRAIDAPRPARQHLNITSAS